MLKKKNARPLKKVFAILLAVVLLMEMNGSQMVLRARAEGPEPGIEFWFDDRGNPDGTYVSVDGNRIGSGSLLSASSGNTYSVQLTPPEERVGVIPVVEARIYFDDKAEEILSSCPFWDGVQEQPANLTITEGAFDIVIPAEGSFSKAVVNIWWSEYDMVGGSDEEYCVEVCINGCGEAYVEGIEAEDYFTIWEYTEIDEESHEIHSGAEKIVIKSSVYATGKTPILKFNAYEGNSFGRFQVNLGESVDPIVIDAADLEPEEEPKFELIQELFNESNWYYVNTELNFEGSFDPNDRPSFNVFYDDYLGEVDISGTGYEEPAKLVNGRVESFNFGETYTFTLLPPENRKKDCAYIVEARIHNFGEPDTIYSNVGFFDEKAGEDADPNLPISNNQFSLDIPAEEAFCGIDISIWWSEFDKICGWYDEERQEGEYCIQIRNDGRGEAFFENNPYPLFWEFNGKDIETGDDIGYGAQKYMVPRKDVEDGKAILKFASYDGYIFRELEIEVPGSDPVLLDADDLTAEPEYQLKKNDFDECGNMNSSVRFDIGSQPGEDFTVFYRVEGDGTVLFAPDFDTTDNNGWKVGTLVTDEITINVSPYEGCALSNLKIDGNDFVGDVVNNEYSWKLHSGENYVEIIFGSGNNPGGGDSAADRLKEYIEGQSFLFGDWNEDGTVNEDDLKQGIAQQIFYPQFSDPRSHMRFGETYPEIESYNDLVTKITVTENSSKNINAIAGNDREYTISAYTYTFVFEDPSKEERNVNVEGTAWLFDFSDASVYATDSVTDVLMEIKDAEGTSTYFLRNCGNESADFVDPVTKAPSGEGACCAVGDYKVEFDSAKNKYIRSVAIYGNGASLDDFLMTEDSEIQMCTFQGRNDMLVKDAFGEGSSHPVIFGKFSFYKDDFSGMKIQGDGAAGNTPAWAFATDPIWGTGEETGTEKEATVYFGNEKVYFSPVTINGNVSDIADIKKTDASIPDGAVNVYQDGDKWIAEFFTNFYDRVEFTVTYETNEGPKTEYIFVHRVGIDIQTSSGGSVGDKKTIYHGTENGPEYTLTEECETLVYATYYYPEENGTTELVDLYATYTWKDGSVTKEVIHNDSSLHLDYHHPEKDNPGSFTDDVQTDDFILYAGSKAGAPQKIEVSVVVAGFDNNTSFTGMRLGSGKGVCWNNNIEN